MTTMAPNVAISTALLVSFVLCAYAAPLAYRPPVRQRATPPDPSLPIGYCDPGYECQFSTFDQHGKNVDFNLQTLCSGTDYVAVDSKNNTYNFNICGISHFQCLPTWNNTFQYGVAVQSFGATPPCNLSSLNCVDPEAGEPQCCSKDCQVLGVGIPQWKPLDPNDVQLGGISITHTGVPPSPADPFRCPKDPDTGAEKARSVTFKMLCDGSVPENTVDVVAVYENATSPCSYTIEMRASAACGCQPQCNIGSTVKNCGSDGCGGFCGGLNGNCPTDYVCTADKICCRPDCKSFRCGSDGCGGTCKCAAGTICGTDGICTGHGPVPPKSVEKTSGGAIAGAFFGGLFTAIVVGGIGIFVYQRQSSAGYSMSNPFSGLTSKFTGGSSSSSAAVPTSYNSGSAYES